MPPGLRNRSIVLSHSTSPQAFLEVAGDKEVADRLRGMSSRDATKAIRNAFYAGAVVVKDAMKQRVKSVRTRSGGDTGTIDAIVRAIKVKRGVKLLGRSGGARAQRVWARAQLVYQAQGGRGASGVPASTPAGSPRRARLAHLIEWGRQIKAGRTRSWRPFTEAWRAARSRARAVMQARLRVAVMSPHLSHGRAKLRVRAIVGDE